MSISQLTSKLLGGFWCIELKQGGKFMFKVTESVVTNGHEYIRGYDENNADLQIDVADIKEVKPI